MRKQDRKKYQQDDEHPGEHTEPAEHCKYDAGSVHTVRIEPAADDKQRYTDQQTYRSRQLALAKVLNWITAVAAALAGFYGIVTYLQFRDSHRNFTIDQRAWVVVQRTYPNQIQLAPNQSMQLTAFITDTGKTAARNVKALFVVEKLKNGQAPSFDYSGAIPLYWFTTGIMLPGEQASHVISRRRWIDKATNQSVDFPMSQSEWDEDFKTGNAYVVAYATVDYLDIFGVQHWYHYCTFNAVNIPGHPYQGAEKCTQYNDTDTNQ